MSTTGHPRSQSLRLATARRAGFYFAPKTSPALRAVAKRGAIIAGLLSAILIAGSSPAATIHKSDDTTATGDIAAIHDGKIALTAKPKPIEISFEDIAQIVLKEPVAPPPPPPPPQPVADAAPQQQQESSGLFGMLFGSRSSNSAPVAQASAPANPPQAHAITATTGPTSQPAGIASGIINLTDGDILHAKVLGWADQKIQLSLASGGGLELPSTAVTDLWLGTLDLQAKAKALTVEPGPEDIAFVAKENDVVAVKGLVLGIAGSSLQFRYDNEDRKIGLQKIVGLLLRGNTPSPLAGFHQRINLDNGDRLSGSLTGLEQSNILLTASALTLKLPIASITTIDFINGRVTSLCDLKPTKVDQTPYFGHLMPFKTDHSLTGGPLITQDGTIARGIAVHSRCVLSYELTGDIDRFKTRLAFQQPQGLHGRVVARVLGDGKPLYENPDARGDQPAIDIDVPLAGVHTLTLEIDFGKDQDTGDRVVWENPRLIRGK